MSYRARFPPLWALPFLISKLPRMTWMRLRKDYHGAMRLGREMMGSATIKTRAFRGYEPTAHDVFVCTYSKSGTYWMLQIVTQIAGRGAAELGHIHDVVPWPETPVPGLARLAAPSWRDAPTEMRAIKTHAEARFVPYGAAAKYVVVLRDPKDALISSFHFSDSIFPGLTSIGLDAWTEAFINGEVPYGSWPEQVAGYWPWRTRANVRVVTFGELKRDLEGVVRRIAELMGVELTGPELAAVVERSGFDWMKRHEAKFRPPVPVPSRQPVVLLRRGGEGEAAEVLSPEQIARVDEAMKSQLAELGSDFPYDEMFGR